MVTFYNHFKNHREVGKYNNVKYLRSFSYLIPYTNKNYLLQLFTTCGRCIVHNNLNKKNEIEYERNWTDLPVIWYWTRPYLNTLREIVKILLFETNGILSKALQKKNMLNQVELFFLEYFKKNSQRRNDIMVMINAHLWSDNHKKPHVQIERAL